MSSLRPPNEDGGSTAVDTRTLSIASSNDSEYQEAVENGDDNDISRLSPVVLNKPLPPLTPENKTPPSAANDNNSTGSSNPDSEIGAAAVVMSKSLAEEIEAAESPNKADSSAVTISAPDDAVRHSSDYRGSTDDPRSMMRWKHKDPAKTSRRQSIKSQRSLPAMFGIGFKSKSDSKAAAPPVPQVPASNRPAAATDTTDGATGSKFGRRLLGALRSGSSNEVATVSKLGISSADYNQQPPKKPSTLIKRNKQMANGNSKVSEDVARSPPIASNVAKHLEPVTATTTTTATTSRSGGGNVEEDIVVVDTQKPPIGDYTELTNETKTNPDEILQPPPPPPPLPPPPPPPAKDSPPLPLGLPSKVYSPSIASSTYTWTKEQKRQSNAAHRLAGLFKRKPSVPDIPLSNTTSPQYHSRLGIETEYARGGIMGSELGIQNQQYVVPHSASPAHHHTTVGGSKDRRLSTSTSTPNLADVAAAAASASQDQSTLAVNAATERGDIPPMPAPPALRPSMSSNAQLMTTMTTTTNGVLNGEERRQQLDVMHKPRGDSLNIAANRAMKLRPPQISATRPSLKLPTRSAMEVMTLGNSNSEHRLQASNGPLTASVDGSAIRGRKSSVATTHSIMGGRGNNGMLGVSNVSQQAAAQRRLTLFDVEDDQRLELLEPLLATFHPDLGPAPPKTSPLSALWFLNTLHRSMVTNGAYLTNSLFIPKRMWFQTGIRVAAIETKLSVLSHLTQSFASAHNLVNLPDIDGLFAPEGGDARNDGEREDAAENGEQQRDGLHKVCVATHHWLNNLEESLDSHRRLLAKKLKFISPFVSSSGTGSSSTGAMVDGEGEVNHMQSSFANLPAAMASTPGGSIETGQARQQQSTPSNSSFPNLSLSNGDISGPIHLEDTTVGESGLGNKHAPMYSPLGSNPAAAATAGSISGAMMSPGIASSGGGMSRDQLSKDQMGNARFKGFGKLGKSVDRLYSNIQKEKLDDTSVYVLALQRMFEATMVLENLMRYFSRVACDGEMAGWFSEVPQSPVSATASHHQRPRQHSRGKSESTGRGVAISPSIAQATLNSQPSMSSLGSVAMASAPGNNTASAGGRRKSSNASNSMASSNDKKNRRRSNYFGHRKNSSTAMALESSGRPSMGAGTNGERSNNMQTRPPGDAYSAIPRAVPVASIPSHGVGAGGSSNCSTTATGSYHRFVITQSPISNPMSFVQQGKGRAPGVIYARLIRIAEWLNQVVLAWVVRDLQVLLAKYIKRLREWVVE